MVYLTISICKSRNYHTTKSRGVNADAMQMPISKPTFYHFRHFQAVSQYDCKYLVAGSRSHNRFSN